MKVWHASPIEFTEFDLSKRIDQGNHANSGLGIFTATRPAEYITGFGLHVYEIDLIENARHLSMRVDELRKSKNDSREEFDAEGRRLGQEYDIIDLVEMDGRIEQMIILNTSAIQNFRRMCLEEFAELS